MLRLLLVLALRQAQPTEEQLGARAGFSYVACTFCDELPTRAQALIDNEPDAGPLRRKELQATLRWAAACRPKVAKAETLRRLRLSPALLACDNPEVRTAEVCVGEAWPTPWCDAVRQVVRGFVVGMQEKLMRLGLMPPPPN